MLLINNFVKKNYFDPDTDGVIKLYLILGALLGADRLDLYDIKRKFKISIRIFAVALNAGIVFLSVRYPCETTRNRIVLAFCLIEYYIYILTAHFSRGDIRSYLVKLQTFDRKHGNCIVFVNSKTTFRKYAKSLFVIVAFLGLYIFALLTPLFCFDTNLSDLLIQVVAFELLHIVESMLYTDLLKLILHRLESSNNFLNALKPNRLSFSEGNVLRICNKHNYIAIKRIHDTYKLLVQAATSLNNAIEWQLMAVLVLDFVPRLLVWYIIVEMIIGKFDYWWAVSISAGIGAVINLGLQTMPCLVCEQIRREVEKIKETTSIHLCFLLDKESRKSSRNLLATLKQHDLSIRPLRLLNVGLSLPVRCLSLTFTYLIILLQFGKLIENHLINEKN